MPSLVEHRREREDVAHVVVDDQRLLAVQRAVRAVQRLERLALALGHHRGAAMRAGTPPGRASLERVAPRASRTPGAAAASGCGRFALPPRYSTIGSWQMPARRSSASITSSGPKSPIDSSTITQSASASAARIGVARLRRRSARTSPSSEREQLVAHRRSRQRPRRSVAERPVAVARRAARRRRRPRPSTAAAWR